MYHKLLYVVVDVCSFHHIIVDFECLFISLFGDFLYSLSEKQGQFSDPNKKKVLIIPGSIIM